MKPTDWAGVRSYRIPGEWELEPAYAGNVTGNRTGVLHIFLKALKWPVSGDAVGPHQTEGCLPGVHWAPLVMCFAGVPPHHGCPVMPHAVLWAVPRPPASACLPCRLVCRRQETAGITCEHAALWRLCRSIHPSTGGNTTPSGVHRSCAAAPPLLLPPAVSAPALRHGSMRVSTVSLHAAYRLQPAAFTARPRLPRAGTRQRWPPGCACCCAPPLAAGSARWRWSLRTTSASAAPPRRALTLRHA